MKQSAISEQVTFTTFLDVLQTRAQQHPNKVAYTFQNFSEESEETFTYGELDRRARAIAAYLQSQGEVGKRVLLLYPAGADYVAAYFGCLYAGDVAVPAYPPSSKRLMPRLQSIVEDSSASVVLTTESVLGKMKSMFLKNTDLEGLVWMTTDQLPAGSEDNWQSPNVTADTLAFLQYTSGSTSLPKGVMVTHGNLIHNSQLIQESFQTTPDDVGVFWLPPYHDMGLIGGLLQPLYTGFPATVFSPYDFMQRPVRWVETISRLRATVSGGPNFAYDLVAEKITEEQKRDLDLSSWKIAFNGAEPIRQTTLDHFAKTFKDCGFADEAFYPCYGLAEGTLFVTGGEQTAHPVVKSFDTNALEASRTAMLADETHEDASSRTLVGNGQVPSSLKVLIVNTETYTACAEGEVGEIWVAGASVAKGYWNRAQQTKETFHAYLTDTEEGPFLRTGDLGFLFDGELFVTGRAKDLMIIRGRNHYPQDIELTVENSHPDLRKGASAAFSVTVNGEERLVIAQEVNRHQQNLNVEEVAGVIRSRVAEEHGVQVHAVLLLKFASIPKTSSGKIQRHACKQGYLDGTLTLIGSDVLVTDAPEADDSLSMLESVHFSRAEWLLLPEAERMTSLVAYLKRQIARSLHVSASKVEAADTLIRLGVDSLAAVQLQNELEQDLGIALDSALLLEDLSVTELAEKLRGLLEASEETVPATAWTTGVEDSEYAMSRGQQGLWFLYRRNPNNAAYNVSRASKIVGELNETALRTALQQLVARHAVLRTSFFERNGELLQAVKADAELVYQYEDLTGLSDAQLAEWLEQEAARPFDLEQGQPMRVHLFKRSSEEHIMLWAFHHIVIDYWSLDVLFRDLSALYAAAKNEEQARLPQPTAFADFVAWQKAWLERAEGERKWQYWQQQLQGNLPLLNLPTDHPRPLEQSYRGATSQVKLDRNLTEQLKALSQKQGVTLYQTLLAAYGVLLRRHTGQDDLIIGSYMASRTRAELAELVGYLTNAVPLRFDLSGNLTFSELLKQVHHVTLGAFAHQDYPFDLLVEKLQPERHAGITPLFQTAFVMQNVGTHNKMLAPFALHFGEASINMDDLQLQSLPIQEEASLFDLTVTVAEWDAELVVNFQYSTDLFEAVTIERMMAQLQVLLTELVQEPEQAITTVPLLPAQEQKLLADWSTVRTQGQTDTTLLELFDRQAALHTDRVAVVYEGKGLTYGELNRRANQLAHHLQAQGVGPEVLVGISMERSVELIVGILGILKAGGAYVPLDPAYPADRLTYMIEDSKTPVILTQEHLLGNLPDLQAKLIHLSENWAAFEHLPTTAPVTNLTADHLAYVIYTSGSTGIPKGVLIPHRQVVRLFASTDEWFGFNEQDVWTMFHSYAFDFSVWEIWGALLYGGRLVVVPYWVSRTPEEFHRLLVQEQVTVLNQTPSAFRQLIRADETAEGNSTLALRYVIFGGEALEVQSLQPWFDRHGDAKPQLINMYGITETTVHVTYRPLSRHDLNKQSSVIGTAIPDLQVFLLDAYMQQVPIGVHGELFIGGVGVARGYLNRPELTAERFVEIPALAEGTRLYRSGDLARFLPNGELEYLGRIDHQVKIRGFRIELPEIEAVLAQHEKIQDQVVMVREDEPGDKKLVAYVVAKKGTPPTVSDLRTYMVTKLPDHMVPHAFVLIDDIPLTTNGKVDHKSLPAPDMFAVERAQYAPPTSFEEQLLVSIWEQVLGVHPIGIDDNFFLLGGDSIRSIKVSSLAKEQGLELTLEQIFQNQTIRELAAIVKIGQATGTQEPLAPFALIAEEDRLLMPEDVEDAYPIPAIQMSYYYHSESSDVYKAYLGTYRIRGPFHEEAFNEAFRRMVKRHEIFRTSFDMSSYSTPLQLVHQTAEIKINVTDLRHLKVVEQQEYIQEFVYAEERNKFDWKQPGLIRFHAHRLSDEIFQFTMCEPLLDGWSAASTMTEVFTTYLQVIKHPEAPEEPKLKAKFSRFIQMELATKASKESNDYWEQKLSDVTTTQLPRWTGEEANFTSDKNDRVIVPISQEVSEGLLRLARKLSVPIKDVVLAAHMKVVSLLSGQTDVVTGIVSGGRPEEEDAEKVLGAMVNTMPFRLDLAGGTWEDIVRMTFEHERDALQHRRYPLVDLQRKYSGGQRLFETIFNYTHFHVYQQVGESGELEILDGWHRESAYVPLTVQFTVDPQSSQLMCVLDYYPEDLCHQQMEYIAAYYANTLEAMANDSTAKHEAQCLLGAEEQQRLLLVNNQKQADFPTDRCFQDLFQAQAAKTPTAIAIRTQREEITYAELSRRSNQLAHYLRTLGVQSGKFVGYFGERNVDWAVAMLAIFKLGAVYIPLDPKYPSDRLEYMIEHSTMSVLLTYEHLLEKVPPQQQLQIVCQDRDSKSIAQASAEPIESGITSDDLAYVIYTSGSTGRPKGAMIKHKGMVNHLYAKSTVLGLTEQDVVAQNASQCFDVSVWQLLTAFLVGGTTYITPDEAEVEPDELLQVLGQAGLTILETVPTVLQAMLESIDLNEETRPRFTEMRWVVVSGEALPPELVRHWFRYYPHAHMINACGATECSDDVTHEYITEPPAADVKFMPIGDVIPNSTLYVLDHALQPVPFGVPGELCYGGICVGRGYLNDPEKTANAFQVDAFSDQPNARLYRTGDLVRMRNDGVIEFLGRIDHQVKIRGFRIELGEVEAVLNQHPDVLQVVAMARNDDRGNKRLVAYLTLVPGASLTPAELREFMKQSVPEYMVASFFVILDQFPMTLNGKVDRKKLPAPTVDALQREYVAPTTDVERQVAEIWGQALGYEQVSMEDDFFDNGGESLIATRLVSVIRKHFEIELPLRTLFEVTTVRGISQVVQQQLELQQDDEMQALLAELDGVSLEEALALLADDSEEE